VPVSPDVLAYLRKAFTDVVTDPKGTATWRFIGWPQGQIPVAGKTGTAEVYGKQPTAWFVSFAPANDPQYVTVMMLTQGGTGSGAAAPSVRDIYEAIYGIAGPRTDPAGTISDPKNTVVDPARAIFPNGRPPATLPVIRPDGTIVQPPPDARAPVASSVSQSSPPRRS